MSALDTPNSWISPTRVSGWVRDRFTIVIIWFVCHVTIVLLSYIYGCQPKNRGETPQNGWSIMENPIKMDELGVPLFLEIPIS